MYLTRKADLEFFLWRHLLGVLRPTRLQLGNLIGENQEAVPHLLDPDAGLHLELLADRISRAVRALEDGVPGNTALEADAHGQHRQDGAVGALLRVGGEDGLGGRRRGRGGRRGRGRRGRRGQHEDDQDERVEEVDKCHCAWWDRHCGDGGQN